MLRKVLQQNPRPIRTNDPAFMTVVGEASHEIRDKHTYTGYLPNGVWASEDHSQARYPSPDAWRRAAVLLTESKSIAIRLLRRAE